MTQGPAGIRARLRTVFKLVLVFALILAANYTVHWLAGALNLQIRPSNEDAVHRTILASAIAYILLLAIPFVPGVEIAVSLIVVLGPKIVWLIYVCTLLGLCLSFIVGRLVPIGSLIGLLEALGFTRAGDLMREIAPMPRKQRLKFLLRRAPNRYLPFLLRHRYIALALAINLPGNFIIGGGGGIAMTAGVTGLFSVPGFVVTTAIAVIPVPLAVHFFGSNFLSA